MVWEYKIVYFCMEERRFTDEDDYEERLHRCEHGLNQMGSEGWEVVAFLPHTTAHNQIKYHTVFKRPKAG